MNRLVLTVEAAADIDRVIEFLATKSPEAANRAYSAIADQLEKIMLYPAIYRPVAGSNSQREAVLAFGTHGYVLRYGYDPEAETVIVLRVWHQREKKL